MNAVGLQRRQDPGSEVTAKEARYESACPSGGYESKPGSWFRPDNGGTEGAFPPASRGNGRQTILSGVAMDESNWSFDQFIGSV